MLKQRRKKNKVATDETTKKDRKKRKEPTCSLCNNHGKVRSTSRHKCPYKNCLCTLCTVTVNGRLTMKHQQRVWRTFKVEYDVNSRVQKCDKCRNHNLLELKSRHMCPFADCPCSLCGLSDKRKRIMKSTQKAKRRKLTMQTTIAFPNDEEDAMENTEIDLQNLNLDAKENDDDVNVDKKLSPISHMRQTKQKKHHSALTQQTMNQMQSMDLSQSPQFDINKRSVNEHQESTDFIHRWSYDENDSEETESLSKNSRPDWVTDERSHGQPFPLPVPPPNSVPKTNLITPEIPFCNPYLSGIYNWKNFENCPSFSSSPQAFRYHQSMFPTEKNNLRHLGGMKQPIRPQPIFLTTPVSNFPFVDSLPSKFQISIPDLLNLKSQLSYVHDLNLLNSNCFMQGRQSYEPTSKVYDYLSSLNLSNALQSPRSDLNHSRFLRSQ